MLKTITVQSLFIASLLFIGPSFAHATYMMGAFSASPSSGNAPLLVNFSYIAAAGHTYTIDFGDGSNGSLAFSNPCNIEDCIPTYSMSHTYATPGAFTAVILENGSSVVAKTITVTSGSSTQSLIATLTALVQQLEQQLQQLLAARTVSAPPNFGSSPSFCAAYADLKRGDTDATTGGRVSALQRLIGVSNVSGFYGALTGIGYTNKCVGGNAQPTAVAGMSKYTDSDFGFSFWYPSSMQVLKTPNLINSGSTLNDSEIMNGPNTQILGIVTAPDFTAYEINSPKLSVLSSVDAGCCGSSYDKYYFDTSRGMWMYADDGGPKGGSGGISPADISNNTMGGLHIFKGYTRFGIKVIIPLSATHFLAIYAKCNDATDYSCAINNVSPTTGQNRFNTAVQTIVATDPTVAVPLSTAQQIATIQAEANAYGVSAANSSQPYATIDQVSLTSSSGNPTITGTAYGVSQVHVTISKSGDNVTSVDANVDATGHWSAYFGGNALYGFTTLPPTTYAVNVSDATTGKFLMNGVTLTITNMPGSTSSSLQTYTNSQYGFSVQYPTDVSINTGSVPVQSYASNLNAGTQVDVIGPITKGFTATESGWGDNGFVTTTGKVTFLVSTNASDVASCMSAPASAEQGPYNATNKTINGITFLTYGMGGPAAGLFNNDTIYKTLHNGVCYSVDAEVSGGESGHMNATDAAANNSVIAQMNSELNSIVQSFGFTTSIPNGSSANIDSNSLTTNFSRPVLTGSANVTAVNISIQTPSGTLLMGSGDVQVQNGRWTWQPCSSLGAGQYNIQVSDWNTGTLLAYGTLVVQSPVTVQLSCARDGA